MSEVLPEGAERFIRAPSMSPFFSALSQYHRGDKDAAFVIRRDDGFEQRVPAAVFFHDTSFPLLEDLALDECRGRILDVGAAAGRHSLELIRRNHEVTALEILPEMEGILRSRSVEQIVIADVRSYQGERFDTLLMLMNGIGMTGNAFGLSGFLRHAHGLLEDGGQILCDSIDVSLTANPVHMAYWKSNLQQGRDAGQQRFRIQYEELVGEEFEWLHVDFTSLNNHAQRCGWDVELIASEADGHYLARLTARKAVGQGARF